MDRLWKVELAYEENPDVVNQDYLELHQNTMFTVAKGVLLDQKKVFLMLN
jgi:hypothetical protein